MKTNVLFLVICSAMSGCATSVGVSDQTEGAPAEAVVKAKAETPVKATEETDESVEPNVAFGPVSAKPRALLPGRWAWLGLDCTEVYYDYELSEDRASLIATSPRTVNLGEVEGNRFEYQILNERERVLTTVIANEDRLTDDGNTIIWNMMMINDNAFCWNRMDRPNTCTKPLLRCETG